MNKQRTSEGGFTLMEIIVATGIFTGVLFMMLVLLNYTLKINRRVESIRLVTQSARNFTEFLVREVRNGNIDYTGTVDAAHCPATTPVYDPDDNQSLALLNRNGDRECFFLDTAGAGAGYANLMVTRRTVSGQIVTEQVNPPGVKIDPALFRFYVRPITSPYQSTLGGGNKAQPFVTMVMTFAIQNNPSEPIQTLSYQTTVSTDVYDIPHQ